jgi:hypothetical protein
MCKFLHESSAVSGYFLQVIEKSIRFFSDFGRLSRQYFANNVLLGRETGTDIVRLYNITETTVVWIFNRVNQAGVPE